MLPIGAHDAGPRPWASLSISEGSKTSNNVVVGERHVFCCRGLNCQPERQGEKNHELIQQRTKRVPCHYQLLCFDQNRVFGDKKARWRLAIWCQLFARLPPSYLRSIQCCSVLFFTSPACEVALLKNCWSTFVAI